MPNSPEETEEEEIERLKHEIIELAEDGEMPPDPNHDVMDVVFFPRPGTLMLLNPPKKATRDAPGSNTRAVARPKLPMRNRCK